MIGELRSSLFRLDAVPSLVRCGTDRLLLLFDRRHPPFSNFNSAFPSDIVRVKSDVNGFFNPTGVPGSRSKNLTSSQSG